MGPGCESAPPFAQESNLLSCPRRVKDFSWESFLFPAPRPAPRAARRLGAALSGRPLVRRLSYNTPHRGDCKRFPRFFSIGRQLFWITPGQGVSGVLNFFTLWAIKTTSFTIYKPSTAARTQQLTIPRNSFMKVDPSFYRSILNWRSITTENAFHFLGNKSQGQHKFKNDDRCFSNNLG